MSSAPSTTTTPATGFTESSFEAFLKTRETSRVMAPRPPPTGVRDRSPRMALPTVTRRGMAADRHPGAEARRLRAADPCRRLRARTDRPWSTAWEALAAHYATGLEHVNASPTRSADPAKLGGAILVDLASAAKDHPEILERYFLTDAVSPTADAFSALHAAFWTGGTLLYVPKGVKVEAPLFTLVGLAGSGRVDLDHTLVVLEDGAEATLVRETASVGREGELRRCTRGRSSCSLATGRSSSSSMSRTGTPRPGTSAESGPWSARTPRSSGPSAAWGLGWPRSTRKSR